MFRRNKNIFLVDCCCAFFFAKRKLPNDALQVTLKKWHPIESNKNMTPPSVKTPTKKNNPTPKPVFPRLLQGSLNRWNKRVSLPCLHLDLQQKWNEDDQPGYSKIFAPGERQKLLIFDGPTFVKWKPRNYICYTPLKTNEYPLKNDGWKMILSYSNSPFFGGHVSSPRCIH